MRLEEDSPVDRGLFRVSEKLDVSLLLVFSLLLKVWNLKDEVMKPETSILKNINAYSDSAFFIDNNPPLASLLYLLLSNVGSLNNEANPIMSFKYMNISFGVFVVFLTYKTLKLTGTSHNLSLWGSLLLSMENGMVVEQRLVTVYGLYLLLIALFLYAIKSLQINKEKSTIKWFKKLVLTSVVLGLVISTHWTGITFLFYAIYLSASEVWNSIDDLTISVTSIYRTFLIKIVSFISLSLTILLAIWNAHFHLLTSYGDSYDLISPKFQNSLENNHLRHLTKEVYYGSQVMIRNYKTGVYIHSHKDQFRTGHQQVTGFPGFNDADNLFQVQKVGLKQDLEVLYRTKYEIIKSQKVKFLHMRTNGFLRIDESAKPPASEQEYNKEVTTNNDIGDDENGNIEFKLKVFNSKCWESETHEYTKHIRPLGSVFQIYNEKNSCYVLSNGVTLTEGLGAGQSELICIKEPTIDASLWYFDWNDHPMNSKENLMTIPDITFFEKLIEVLSIMVKDNIVGKKGIRLSESDSSDYRHYGGSIADLMYGSRGYKVWSDDSHIIYQLPNYIITQLIIFAIGLFAIIYLFQFVLWNPFKYQHQSMDAFIVNFNHQTMDFLAGFLLATLPLKLVQHPVFLSSYFPSTLMGLFVLIKVVSYIIHYQRTLGVVLIVIVTVLTGLFYFKFHPIIYASSWTTFLCQKVLVVDGWNPEICDVYTE